MEKNPNNPRSVKSDALKRLISEVFILTDYGVLKGLPDRLKALGHHRVAEALEQILESETSALEISSAERNPPQGPQRELHKSISPAKPTVG